MQSKAGLYICGQAMKIELNTLFCLSEKEDSELFYWQECQRPHKMPKHRSSTLPLHWKNKWLQK